LAETRKVKGSKEIEGGGGSVGRTEHNGNLESKLFGKTCENKIWVAQECQWGAPAAEGGSTQKKIAE